MAKQTRTTLKGYFETGDTPSQAEYADLIDSKLNLSENNTGNLQITGDITASGNISASGTIFANNFQSTGGDVNGVSFTDDLNVSGDITASGNIQLSGFISASSVNTTALTIAGAIFGQSTDTFWASGSTGNIYYNGGNVGIGTTSPGEKLTVTGNISASGVGTFASLDISGNIDVDGTTNLDAVDIDGAVDMASTLTIASHITASGNISASGTITGLTGSFSRLRGLDSAGLNTNEISLVNPNIIDLMVVGESTPIAIRLTNSLVTLNKNTEVNGHITSSGNISSSGNIIADRYISDTQTVAAAGSSISDATAIAATSGIIFVTTDNAAKGVKLPAVSTVAIGSTYTIHNTAASTALEIYPTANDKILPLADNAPATLAASTAMVVTAFSADGYVGYFTTVIS